MLLCDQMKLTVNEQSVLGYILEYRRLNNQMPTLGEIKDKLEMKSLTGVQRAVKGLISKKYLVRERYKTRGLGLAKTDDSVNPVQVPIVGAVACGSPILAFEDVQGFVPTDPTFLPGNTDDYFYLRAKGDSMDKAGINNGDLVLVKKQNYANEGEQVVALIDDSATIKTFKKGDGFIALEPQSTNPAHKPIILRNDFLIQGVVAKVFGEM